MDETQLLSRRSTGDGHIKRTHVIEELAQGHREETSPAPEPSLTQVIQAEVRGLSHFLDGAVLDYLLEGCVAAGDVEEPRYLHDGCRVVLVHVLVLKEQMGLWIRLGGTGGYIIKGGVPLCESEAGFRVAVWIAHLAFPVPLDDVVEPAAIFSFS